MSMLVLLAVTAVVTEVESTQVAKQDRSNFLVLRQSHKVLLERVTEVTNSINLRKPCHSFAPGRLEERIRQTCHVTHTKEVYYRLIELKAAILNAVKQRQLGLLSVIATAVPTLKFAFTIFTNVYIAYSMLAHHGKCKQTVVHEGLWGNNVEIGKETINVAKSNLIQGLGLLNEDVQGLTEQYASSQDQALFATMVLDAIYRTGQRVQAVINRAEDGYVDVWSLSKLSENNHHDTCSECKNKLRLFDHRYTKYLNVSLHELGMKTIEKIPFDETIEDQHYDPVSLKITFLAVERSQEAEVLEIDPFPHWEESFEATKFLKYNGPRFVLHNRTNDCITSLHDERSELIIQQCRKANSRDLKLESWVPEPNTEYRQQTVVKHYKTNNLIYCFPGNIFYNGMNMSCDYVPMKLLVTKEFNTSDLVYQGANKLFINLTLDDLAIQEIKLTYNGTPANAYTKVKSLLNGAQIELLATRAQLDGEVRLRNWLSGALALLVGFFGVLIGWWLLDKFKRRAQLEVQSTTIEMASRRRPEQPQHTCTVYKSQNQLRAREGDAIARSWRND